MYIDLIINSIVPIITLFVLLLGVSFFWPRVSILFNFNKYDSLHKIHEKEIPKVGGILIILFILFLLIHNNKFDNFFLSLFISSIPLVFIGAKEDLFHNTSPLQRLLSMLISVSIFFLILPIHFPSIEIPILNIFFQSYFFQFIFFCFSSLVIINGMNLIDGANGLMPCSAIMQLASIIFLSSVYNDLEIFNISIVFLLPLVIFLFFNYPAGKIFMGDLGAYFYGFSISLLIIYFFSRHPDLLSWSAILILFYPSIELLTSFIRKKFFENKSPMAPDLRHFHSLVYYLIKQKLIRSKISNNFVLLSMIPFWFFPFVCILLFYNSLNLLLISILLLTIFYLSIYLFLFSKIPFNEISKKIK